MYVTINIKRVSKVAFFTILPCWVFCLTVFVYEHRLNMIALQNLSEMNNYFVLQHIRWSKEQSTSVIDQLKIIHDKVDRLNGGS